MKKFLFTLVSLLCFCGMSAQEGNVYYTIDDFEVSQATLNGATAKSRRMNIPVICHANAYYNIMMVDVLVPEGSGIVLKGATEGDAMTVPYMDAMGTEKNYVAALSSNLEIGRFIAVISTSGYWYPEGLDPDEDDPVSYGAIKFPLGDYTMFTVSMQFDDPTFTGGQIEVVTQNSASDDTRGEICDNKVSHMFTTVTVESAEPVVAAAPVFSMDENYTITATCDNDYYVEINGVEVQLPYTVDQTYEEQTIVVSVYGFGDCMENSETVTETFVVPAMEMPVAAAPVFTMDENYVINAECANNYYVEINGVEVTLPYTVEQTWEEQTFVVTGYGYGENLQNSETVTETFVVPALEPTPAAAPTFIWDEETYTLTVNCNNAYKVYVNGVEVEVPYTVTPTYEEQTIVVTGYGYGEHMTETWAEPATFVVPAMERPVAAAPEITVTMGDDNTSAVVTIVAGEGATIYYSLDGENYVEYNAVLSFQTAGDYVVYAYAVGPEPYTQSETVSREFTVEAPVLELTGDPSIHAVAGNQLYVVSVDAPEEDPNATIYYRYQFNNGEWSEWTLYTGEMVVDVYGTYMYEAYAIAEGKAESHHVYVGFTLDETTTAVDEVMGGKVIAGTRYFNLAGQEMNAANGACIIVTTYTDGTTSAVKVMK